MAKIVRLIVPKRDATAQPPPELSPAAVKDQLQRIVSSELFASSDRLRRLLQFVAEETLEGRRGQLKEYNLGVAVFDRGSSYDPRTDPIVRVEAGRLRARLASYYSTAGAGDPLIIDLPKGGYGITYAARQPQAEPEPEVGSAPARPAAVSRDWRNLALAAALLATGLLAFQNVRLRSQAPTPRQPAIPPEVGLIWAPFLASQSETVIVFGSPMFFEAEGKRLFVRPYDLNDPANVQNNPAYIGLRKALGPLSEPRYAYAQVGDAMALNRLGTFLGTYGKSPKALPANLATWDSITDKNIIFLGSERVMPMLARLPLQLDFDVQPDNFVLNRSPRSGEKSVYPTPSHADAFSYTVIASAPGLKPNRHILVITSHGSAGTNAGVEYLTSTDSLRELASKLQARADGATYYQILLRVLAENDEGFKTEYVTHHTSVP